MPWARLDPKLAQLTINSRSGWQQQYARQWWNRRLQLIGRIDAQFADSPLPVLEQISVGGADTVRGYRENVLVRDQVLLGSLELRYALLGGTEQSSYGRLDGAVFTDAAKAWNRGAYAEVENLLSVGLGLLWLWRETLQAQLYWGRPFVIVHRPSNSKWYLQDEGIHFRVQATY